MTITLDELFVKATQLSPIEQAQLVHRLLDLRSKQQTRSILPPGTPGTVWLENWEQVKIAPFVADDTNFG